MSPQHLERIELSLPPLGSAIELIAGSARLLRSVAQALLESEELPNCDEHQLDQLKQGPSLVGKQSHLGLYQRGAHCLQRLKRAIDTAVATFLPAQHPSIAQPRFDLDGNLPFPIVRMNEQLADRQEEGERVQARSPDRGPQYPMPRTETWRAHRSCGTSVR